MTLIGFALSGEEHSAPEIAEFAEFLVQQIGKDHQGFLDSWVEQVAPRLDLPG